MMTWTQLNIHQKPVGILNVGGFYDHLLAQLQHAVEVCGVTRPAVSRPACSAALRCGAHPCAVCACVCACVCLCAVVCVCVRARAVGHDARRAGWTGAEVEP
jgi:hypothetical protein